MSSIPSISFQNNRRLEEVVHPHDVVFECYRWHSGNNWYREMILRYRSMYNSSPEDIAIKIVQSVCQQLPRGRFLSFSLQSNCWVMLTNEQAVKATIREFLQGSTNLQVPSNSRQRINYHDNTCSRPSPMEIYHYELEQQGLSQQSRHYHPRQHQHRGHKDKKDTKASRTIDNGEDASSIIVIDLSTEDDDADGNEKEDGDTQKGSHEGQKLHDGRKVKNNENMGNAVESTSDKIVINLLEDSEDEEDGGKTDDNSYLKNSTSYNDISKNQVLQCTSVEHINDQQNQDTFLDKNKKRIGIRESKDDDLSFDDDEDDVVIVEKVDRFVECQTEDDNDRKYNQDNDDADVRIIGSTGSNALADFAHSREDCVTNPFSKDPKVYCPKCYCYVCDIKASDCTKWDSHFQAKRSEIKWRSQRSKVRNKRKAPEREMQRLGAHLLASTADKLPTKRSRRKLHQKN